MLRCVFILSWAVFGQQCIILRLCATFIFGTPREAWIRGGCFVRYTLRVSVCVSISLVNSKRREH